MIRAAVKGVFANKLRLTLTAFAIVIGVGFVAASYVFTDTINAQFNSLLTDINSGVDVIVRPEQPEFGFEVLSMPEDILETVAGVDGVAVADPAVNGFAQVVASDGEPIGGQGPPTLGVSWTDVDAFNPTTTVSGRSPAGPGEVVIDVSTAETGMIQVGDSVTILSAGAPEEFELVGTVTFGEDNALLGATLAGFELSEAQKLMDLEGRLTVISIQGEAGVSPEELQQRVMSTLPEGVEAITGEADTDEQLAEVAEGLSFLTVALLAFAAVAVFVGAFIITNTFRIIVAQRTKELALLRAVGATGRQVVWMVVIEALIVALVASLIGVGSGRTSRNRSVCAYGGDWTRHSDRLDDASSTYGHRRDVGWAHRHSDLFPAARSQGSQSSSCGGHARGNCPAETKVVADTRDLGRHHHRHRPSHAYLRFVLRRLERAGTRRRGSIGDVRWRVSSRPTRRQADGASPGLAATPHVRRDGATRPGEHTSATAANRINGVSADDRGNTCGVRRCVCGVHQGEHRGVDP